MKFLRVILSVILWVVLLTGLAACQKMEEAQSPRPTSSNTTVEANANSTGTPDTIPTETAPAKNDVPSAPYKDSAPKYDSMPPPPPQQQRQIERIEISGRRIEASGSAPSKRPAKASPPKAAGEGRAPASVPSDEPFAVVRTFFATDRQSTGKNKENETFGGVRSPSMNYGMCDVSIPHDHRIGELEAPSLFRFEFREDPTKHVVVLKTVTAERNDFFAELSGRIKQSTDSSAFLFVHGYNVTFVDAARRTAQMAHDLNFDGAPVFYSWPSQGKTAAYTVDEQNVEWAQTNLQTFLEDFFKQSDAKKIYLIAHSMGNRALTRAAIAFLNKNPDARTRLKEIILTAPDIDAEVFKRDIAPALASSGSPVTLYASSTDVALIASKKVHGYARAGDSGKALVFASGIETVDATGMDTGFLGHSYFAETRSVLGDIFQLIKDGKKANDRFGLEAIDAPNGRYWKFKQ
jgi:esterase/lipase superfamily enzyme